jgi:RsiW-degrading membrane proteinase PrsW (M82 family)
MTGTPQTHVPELPAGARFHPVTGAELGAGGAERRQSFALQPGEPVASFNLVSSLMPLASGSAPQTYRWALGLGILIPVVAGALGYLAFAFVAAALVVPAVYVVYLYDVNQWEDQPVGVVLGAVGAAAALAVGFTFLWHAGLLGDDLAVVDVDGHGAGGVRWTSFLVLVLLVPVVSELLKQIGPILLARRPAFDDMIDGLTFGVASGAAFAAAETIVVNRGLFSTFGQVDSPNAGFWVSLVLSAAVVKPIVYGAATGIAVASFSGLGRGYDGFKPAYLRGLAEALAANIVFQAGLFFAARLDGTTGAVVGLVWGALIAVVLVVRLRHLLHFAVLEAALEASSAGTELKDTVHGTAYCPSCEMPLVSGANFCVVCGTSVRAGSKVTRGRNRIDDTDPANLANAEPARPSLAPTPAGVAPRDNQRTAVVVAAVVAAILLGGVVGQAAASAAADEGDDLPPPSESPVTVDPESYEDELDQGSAVRVGVDEDRNPQAAGGKGGLVSLSDDVLFLVPKGFKIEVNENGFARVYGQKGYFFAYLTPTRSTLPKLIRTNLTELQEETGIEDLAITQPQAIQVSGVQGAARLTFRGLLASQQGGSIPVEGFAFYFVREDGTGATAFAIYGKGALKPGGKLLAGYNTMLNTLISTL